MPIWMKLSHKRYVPQMIIIVAIVIVALLWLFKPQVKPKVVAKKAWPIAAMVLERADLVPTLLLYGSVDSTQHSLLTSRVSARVKRIAVRDGEPVHKEQLLVALDPKELELVVTRRKADLLQAQSQKSQQALDYNNKRQAIVGHKKIVEIAARKFARSKSLSQKQFISSHDLDIQKHALTEQQLVFEKETKNLAVSAKLIDQANAAIVKAQAALTQARYDVDDCKILAPFSGVVTGLYVARGEQVNLGSKIIKVLNRDDLEVRALVPENYLQKILGLLKQHKDILARASVYNKPVVLVLKRIAADIKPGQVGREGIFAVAEGQDLLAAQYTFPLVLQLPVVKDRFWIPLTALHGNDKIYKIIDHHLKGVRITIFGRTRFPNQPSGLIIDGPGLRDGTHVLITPLANAIDGLLVTLRDRRL